MAGLDLGRLFLYAFFLVVNVSNIRRSFEEWNGGRMEKLKRTFKMGGQLTDCRVVHYCETGLHSGE